MVNAALWHWELGIAVVFARTGISHMLKYASEKATDVLWVLRRGMYAFNDIGPYAVGGKEWAFSAGNVQLPALEMKAIIAAAITHANTMLGPSVPKYRSVNLRCCCRRRAWVLPPNLLNYFIARRLKRELVTATSGTHVHSVQGFMHIVRSRD